MKVEPSDGQFFGYFGFAIFCAIFVGLHTYGAATLMAFAAIASKEGWPG